MFHLATSYNAWGASNATIATFDQFAIMFDDIILDILDLSGEDEVVISIVDLLFFDKPNTADLFNSLVDAIPYFAESWSNYLYYGDLQGVTNVLERHGTLFLN